MAMFCLGANGVPFVHEGKHIYASATWLAQLHPQRAEAIQTIAANPNPVGTRCETPPTAKMAQLLPVR